MKKITIATRESPLALWQAHWVKSQLEKIHDITVGILGITTSADRMLTSSLIDVGGKGLFVKELEEALLSGEADIAVHSMKDMPMEYPDDLDVPVICHREDPRDVLVSSHASITALPKQSVIGTSSLRRHYQLVALRADLQTKLLRGNVQTRLDKLDRGEFSGVILAAAGLKRLQLQHRITAYLSYDEMLPAPGQGALGIECHKKNKDVAALIAPLNDPDTFSCVTAERAFCRYLGGGCRAPIAAYAEIRENTLYLRGMFAEEKTQTIQYVKGEGSITLAEQLGIHVAQKIQ